MAASTLHNIVHGSVHNSYGRGTLSVAEQMASSFTRIKIEPQTDFTCTYEVTPEGLTIKLQPLSDYGKMVMEKTYDAECAHELKDAEKREIPL